MGFEPHELNQHLETLYRYAIGVTHDPHLAADAVQDTMTRALERREQYRNDAPLGHWLIRIAHNLMIDHARRADREVVVDEIETDWQNDAYTVDAEAVVLRAATRDELRDALVHLPYIYRSAVVLHDVEGLRVSDVAAIHGVSLPAAKQRLRRGRMALVSALASGPQRRIATKGVPMRCW
ncbi:MAG: RNA polymerase sigma factor, partial [Acidimicrobiia bacterium]|nr:RNA polymerase sigma factor [Acidimicrobiia bacterium]